MSIEAAILFEAAHKRPAIVANPLQEGSGGMQGITQDIVRAAVQTLAGIAESLERQRVFSGTMCPPPPQSQGDAKRSVGPHQEDEGEAIDGLSLHAGEHQGKTFDRYSERLQNHRIVEDEIAS